MYNHMPFLSGAFNSYSSFSSDDTTKDIKQDTYQLLSVVGSGRFVWESSDSQTDISDDTMFKMN